MIWVIFTKIMINKFQVKNAQLLIKFDDMNADMLNNNKLQPIATYY